MAHLAASPCPKQRTSRDSADSAARNHSLRGVGCCASEMPHSAIVAKMAAKTPVKNVFILISFLAEALTLEAPSNSNSTLIWMLFSIDRNLSRGEFLDHTAEGFRCSLRFVAARRRLVSQGERPFC